MKLELCAASIDAIHLAKEFNFDRIELCQNLEYGGVTPSYGMIEYAIAYGIETHVLIRPRPGGFLYQKEELEIMLREVKNCSEMGAKGVVVGVLNDRNNIDSDFLKEIIDKANGMEVTFHRAFDDVIDWKKALDILIDLKINRLLSSGMARNVDQGLPILKEMIDYAKGSIEIMPGGGVNAGNILKIKKTLNVNSIHFSGTSKVDSDEDSFFSDSILKVDREKIKRILKALNENI
jgi:copper homeostasis protein